MTYDRINNMEVIISMGVDFGKCATVIELNAPLTEADRQNGDYESPIIQHRIRFADGTTRRISPRFLKPVSLNFLEQKQTIERKTRCKT